MEAGHLLKVTTDFSEALQLAYDQDGFCMTDKDRNMLLESVKRGNIRNIRIRSLRLLLTGASSENLCGEHGCIRNEGLVVPQRAEQQPGLQML